jgi:hypothetical protein
MSITYDSDGTQYNSADPPPPPAAREILAILPASQQSLIWQRFLGIASHGCKNPFNVVELALKPLKRSLDRTAATNDLRGTLAIMFSNHNLMLELAREAIQHVRKGAA